MASHGPTKGHQRRVVTALKFFSLDNPEGNFMISPNITEGDVTNRAVDEAARRYGLPREKVQEAAGKLRTHIAQRQAGPER